MLNIEAQKDTIIELLNKLNYLEVSNAMRLGAALYMTARKNDTTIVDANDIFEWLLKKVEKN